MPRRHQRTKFLFPTCLSPAEVSATTGASIREVREWIVTMRLPCFAVGKHGRKLVLVRDLEDFIRRERRV
jgi:hypothetical protein